MGFIMLDMLKPRKSDQIFYDLFSSVLTDTCTAAEKLDKLFRNYADADEKIEELEDLEHRCDKTVHDLINHLNHSFITPFDREDIFLITKVIDNIMDYIEATAYGLRLLNIDKIREESLEMTALTIKCCEELGKVIAELPKMKSSKTLQAKIIEVNRIENQGDVIYRRLVRNLFTTEHDPVEIMKWKEIYEGMEKTLDSCEDVANIIEGIVTKNA